MIGSSWNESVSSEIDNFKVNLGMTFLVDVEVEDAKGVTQTMAFDTGSTHSWIFDYRLLEAGCTGKGISHTQVRTYLDIPEGARQIAYEDSDMVKCDTWTRKSFKLGNTSWIHHFGIVAEAHRRNPPSFSGLIGANLASDFVSSFPVFSFDPHGKRHVQMFLGAFNISEVCLNGEMEYGELVSKHDRFGSHWFLGNRVLFGTSLMGVGLVLDTGASVIGLPPMAFDSFANSMRMYATNFEYFPDKLYAIIDCRTDLTKIPSFEILLSSSKSISVTAAMYMQRLTRSICILNVARLQSESSPVIFGLPLLGNLASQFDSINRRVGFCRSKSWGPDGGLHFANDKSSSVYSSRTATTLLLLIMLLSLIVFIIT